MYSANSSFDRNARDAFRRRSRTMSGGSPRGRPARPSCSGRHRLARAGTSLPIALGDELAHLLQRLGRDARRVGTHVGDQADGAFAAELDALVELLRDAHGAARRVAELARGLLLQARRDERRRREAAALLALDLGDRPRRRRAGASTSASAARLVLDAELLRIELVVADAEQARRERRWVVAFETRGDRPVLLRLRTPGSRARARR